MKLLSVFLIAVFLCQGGSAKPFISGVIGSITKGIGKAVDKAGNIISETSKGWGNIANGIIKKATDASMGAITAGVKFVSNMANGMASLTNTAAQRFANLSKSVEETIRNIGNKGGNTFKQVSTDVKDRINMIKGKVEEVLVDVEAKYNEGLLKLNETLLENTKKIDAIAAELREKYKDASEDQKEKIDELINDFVFKGANEISQCAKEIVEPMQGLYNDTLEAVNDVLPTVQKVVDDLEKCVKEANEGRMKLVQCAVEAKKGLPTISTMADFIANMKKEVEKYNFADLIDWTCVDESWERIRKMRNDLEKDIDRVVEES